MVSQVKAENKQVKSRKQQRKKVIMANAEAMKKVITLAEKATVIAITELADGARRSYTGHHRRNEKTKN